MNAIPRLNGAIRALEQGPARVRDLLGRGHWERAGHRGRYDAVVFEMEHGPYDIRTLRDCLQYLLNRRQIVQAGSLAPAVTPFVRIPPNGGVNSWTAKHAGVWVSGVVWPHVAPSRTPATRSRRAATHGRNRRRTTNRPASGAMRRRRPRATGA